MTDRKTTCRKARELTVRQIRFAQEFAKGASGAEAARRAGYTERGAAVQAVRLLANVSVRAEVDRLLVKSFKAAELSIERVDRAIAAVAFSDITKFYRPDGTMLPIGEWPEHIATAVGALETIEHSARGKPKASGVVRKLRLLDKVAALELAAKRLGLLSSRMHLSGSVSLQDLVMASLKPKKGEPQ